MKRVLLISIPIALVLLVIICLQVTKNNNKPFSLDEKYYNNNNVIEINREELKSLEKNKETFIVFLYQPLCPSSYDFDKYVTEFSNVYNIGIYKMSYSLIKGTSIGKVVKFCPSAIIYKKGKIITYLDAASNKDTKYYKSVDNFKTWLTKYVVIK